MQIRELILHLSLIPDLAPTTIHKLVFVLKSGLCSPDLYALFASDFRALGFSDVVAHEIVMGLKDRTIIDRELLLLERYKFSWVTIMDDAYPHYLANISVPPPVLYWQGNPVWQHNDNMISIVGSRLADAYGQSIIDRFVPELVAHGWTIVSGGALGIDAFAHDATVAYGGKAIVVLGSGLLQWYPRENKKLFDAIIAQGGAIMSCFHLEAEPISWRFPARNRVIAGLSQGSLVVQAAAKSGALITADYALQEGRHVFAVPGSIDNPLSAGCHALIGQGAVLVTSAADILKEFGVPQDDSASQKMLFDTSTPLISPIIRAEKVVKKESDPFLIHLMSPIATFDLAELTGLLEKEVQEKLFELQLNGVVEQNFAGLWQKV